jgi:Ca-activated chloride channel family protein
VSLKVDVETKRPQVDFSPSHKVEIHRHGDTRATVGYEASDVKPDADFQLFFAQEADPVGVNLLTYKTAGEDGYFLLLASPGQVSKDTRVLPKDVAFVLDTSGSMAGAKLEQAKKALLFCVENLNAEDRFEILRLPPRSSRLDQLSNASDEPRRRARTFMGPQADRRHGHP